MSLAVSFYPRLVSGRFGGLRVDERPPYGRFTAAGGRGGLLRRGRRFVAALSGLKPHRGEGGRAAAPGAPGADAENQQERGPGSPVADQPDFPALPALLLQVLPVAEGERGSALSSAWLRVPAERCVGVNPAPGIPWSGSECLQCGRGAGGEPRPVSCGRVPSGLGCQRSIQVSVSARAIRFLPEGMMPPPVLSCHGF